jgi:GlcNAc-P-P-Und epimerase
VSRVVVTGAAGYIGKELVKRLQAHPGVSDVLEIDRSFPEGGDQKVKIELSMELAATLSDRIRGFDTIFHLAAARTDWGLDYDAYFRDNVIATRCVVEAARCAGISSIVHFSTVVVYGPSSEPITEAAPFDASTDYGRTKAQSELELRHAAEVEPEAWSCSTMSTNQNSVPKPWLI